jgi:hypothetical protein
MLLQRGAQVGDFLADAGGLGVVVPEAVLLTQRLQLGQARALGVEVKGTSACPSARY